VLENVIEAARAMGLGAQALIASPILGPEGNREFLVSFHHGVECADLTERIAAVTAP
jgi:predicted rRNA methylase YqxC with S4 and FtsJ domains